MPSQPLHPVRRAALAKLGAALQEGRTQAGLSQPPAADLFGVSVWGMATIRDKLGHSSSDPLTPTLTASSPSQKAQS
jgi:hypothetical protein